MGTFGRGKRRPVKQTEQTSEIIQVDRELWFSSDEVWVEQMSGTPLFGI